MKKFDLIASRGRVEEEEEEKKGGMEGGKKVWREGEREGGRTERRAGVV